MSEMSDRLDRIEKELHLNNEIVNRLISILENVVQRVVNHEFVLLEIQRAEDFPDGEKTKPHVVE